MDLEQQRRCFGTELSVMRCAYDDAAKRQHPSMIAMSMLSDIQEMLDRMSCEPSGREKLRQHLNRAKWVISTYLQPNQETA